MFSLIVSHAHLSHSITASGSKPDKPRPSPNPPAPANSSTDFIYPSRKSIILFFTISKSDNSHSQIIIYFHPIFLSFLWLFMSRFLLLSSLGFQKSSLDLGNRVNLHFPCLCQKQPCTNITFFRDLNAKSGTPGKFLSCNLYLYPKPWTRLLTFFSGFESLERTCDMRSLRSSRLNVSINFLLSLFKLMA